MICPFWPLRLRLRFRLRLLRRPLLPWLEFGPWLQFGLWPEYGPWRKTCPWWFRRLNRAGDGRCSRQRLEGVVLGMDVNDDLDDENFCYCRYGGDRWSGFELESFDQEVEDCCRIGF